MRFNLKYKKNENERGHWNTGFDAEDENEAIEIARERKESDNLKDVRITKTIWREKIIYKFEE